MESENIYMTVGEPESSVILKYIRGNASEEEKAEVETWLSADPEHETVLLQIARIYYANQTQERIVGRDTLRAYQKVVRKLKVNSWILGLKRLTVAAACFIAGILIPFVYQQKPQMSQMMTVQANAGMRTHFNLPDGTVAYLNSGSTLSYPLHDDRNERYVELDGEAYFKVTHDPDKPFVVSVKNDRMRVKVHGTEFNIQAYEDKQIQTTLVSGSVDIEIMRNGQVASKAHLKPSDKAVYDVVSDKISIASVNTELETSWINGRLVFKNMPLPQVLKRLSHFYNVEFKVMDPVLDSYYFTGTFENQQLLQILDYLKISSRIDYTIKRMKRKDGILERRELVELRKIE